jgi:hypothetical protein
MTPTYMSSHHVPVVADDPIDAAWEHRLKQHKDEAPIFEVAEAETGVIHIIDIDAGREVEER